MALVSAALLFVAFIVSTNGHVALVNPPGRTDNDYLYTFDGSCVGASCDSFCGPTAADAYGTGPTSTLVAGVATTIRWYSRVQHEPHQYRLSLNRQTSDGGFDDADNILAVLDMDDAREAQATDYFSTDVTFPTSALAACAGPQPCVLQLYDLYYFVSCANVLLVAADNTATDPPVDAGDPSATTADSIATTMATSEGSAGEAANMTIRFEGASFIDYRVIFRGSTSLDPALELERCQQYTFDVFAPGHPLVIKTTPGLGLANILQEIGGDVGIEEGVWSVMIPEDAPSTLYYQCTLHAEMVGEIRVIDSGLCQEDGDGAASTTTDVPNGAGDVSSGAADGCMTLHGWIFVLCVIFYRFC